MLVLANILRKSTKGLFQSHPSHRNRYKHVNENTRIKTTKSYSINWSPFLMSCCLELLSSETLDMLSWTSTFGICHSSKRNRDKWLLECVPGCTCQHEPLSHQHWVHCDDSAPSFRNHCSNSWHSWSTQSSRGRSPRSQPTSPHQCPLTQYSIFLQRTFLPASNLSLVSTHSSRGCRVLSV